MSLLTRRRWLFAAAGTAAAISSSRLAFAPAMAQSPAGPFKVDPLPYPANALEPHIDAMTMSLHHDKHHQAYVTNLNNFAKDNPQIAEKPITDVLANLNAVPEAIRTGVRNNMGGHANHTMFWRIMGPDGGKPGGEVLAAIDRDLGGIDKLRTDFNAAGGRVFGSGWVFVTVTKEGKLAIET